MSLLFGYFPYFFVLNFILVLWLFYELYRFLRFEGDLKRGVKIGTAPLTWEMRQFLETLPSSVRYGRNFIRKEMNEVLIAREWSFVSGRRDDTIYAAYINLSAPENRLEFRAPLALLVAFTLAPFIFLVFYFNIFITSADDFLAFPSLGCFPVIGLIIFSGGMAVNHLIFRQRLLAILKQAMEQKG
jgi:hypothetical protein